jgi:hypothetical protein
MIGDRTTTRCEPCSDRHRSHLHRCSLAALPESPRVLIENADGSLRERSVRVGDRDQGEPRQAVDRRRDAGKRVGRTSPTPSRARSCWSGKSSHRPGTRMNRRSSKSKCGGSLTYPTRDATAVSFEDRGRGAAYPVVDSAPPHVRCGRARVREVSRSLARARRGRRSARRRRPDRRPRRVVANLRTRR